MHSLRTEPSVMMWIAYGAACGLLDYRLEKTALPKARLYIAPESLTAKARVASVYTNAVDHRVRIMSVAPTRRTRQPWNPAARANRYRRPIAGQARQRRGL